MSWEIIAAGFFVGTMIGLTGMGGGSLITPIMIFIFRVQPVFAVGTDLVLSALTKIAGAITHVRLKNVNFKITGTLLSGSLPGAIVGFIFLRLISYFHPFSIDSFITHSLGAILIVVSVGLFYPPIWKLADKFKSSPDVRRRVFGIRAVSFGIGFAVSITSVGSGSIFVPFLLATYAIPVSQVVGIDVFHGAILTAVAGAGHLANGTVNFNLLLNLLIGSVPGAILGSRLSVSFPKRATEIILGSMLVVSGIKLL
ncbi:MAG TPA: sulfite exporter TauE/SafE family protein [Candidatus Acidoferrales bacterium]|nr:sulfite exporter TauE/SafE family protein [Candidatus Acidoferrales bacterium]